ncbi:thioesterase family protein [Kushneria aurantia]|uniref:Thioesterase family protein n=1 Tax=Kushneria aurantia TaxID=504092 RepID=A0ABV6G1F8_9GAMM|nr:thioesterase family protein [Kushneria aurantia]
MAITLMSRPVLPAWVDYNGHMNDAAYALLFSYGVEALMTEIGLDDSGRAQHGYTLYTLYTLETHLCYLKEAYEGQQVTIGMTLLDLDARRLQPFFTLHDSEGEVLATSEQMLMGIDTASGRPAPFPDAVAAAIERLPRCAVEEWPKQAGRRIGIRR